MALSRMIHTRLRSAGALSGVLLILPALSLAAGPPAPDAARWDLLSATPGVLSGAPGGISNPACWGMAPDGDVAFWWDDSGDIDGRLDHWGLSLGGGLGFSVEEWAWDSVSGGIRALRDWQIGLAGGDGGRYWGAAWRWSSGAVSDGNREKGLALGSVHRPFRHLSLSASSFLSAESDRRNLVGGLGVRPFGTEFLTVFGDYALADDSDDLLDGHWTAGAELRPYRGARLGVRAREDAAGDTEYSLTLGVALDAFGMSATSHRDAGGEEVRTTNLLHSNAPYRGIPVHSLFRPLRGADRVVPVNLENKTLAYQSNRWGDEKRVAWRDLSRHLDRILQDGSASGVAVNIAGLSGRVSLLWELSRKLSEFHEAGKEVYIHLDRVGMNGMALASVADRVTIDPEGLVELPGVALHRTYMKDALAKVGVGFEEWRHFKYKSALEGFSRADMSDADREQLGRIADVLYEETRRAVCEGRGLSEREFDAMVDGKLRFPAREAVEEGLADAVARWHDLGEWLKEERDGMKLAKLESGADLREWHPGSVWGKPDRIALVYAIGPCAMDSGIRGRATGKHLRELAKRKDVAAVVLRADSPGGGALPSDLVAEGLTKCRDENKPVIVSQGNVAASGGYWISMDADRILTTPVTVTGSIGVIGGWVWDNGLGEKTGFHSDGVQRGAHADLTAGTGWFGVIRLPKRNLDEEERARIGEMLVSTYGDFVGRVAVARGLPEEEVRRIAQGRVWMGADAVELGLCDDIGSLDDALAEAREAAGIGPDETALVMEFPKRKLITLDFGVGLGMGVLERIAGHWLPGFAGSRPETRAYERTYLEAMVESPGRPLVMTPPDCLPDGWADEAQ
ncbi:MAG: S49 family peptidase [Gemmatimonadota bacterium]|nr:S49 family peptidase [Gemmatimonadota bacterium]